ncbi:MAG TPA: NAD(P)/FAD-dependent oxidoreductase [Vicinamibacteria bacterium]|nr:NAD(P)/FAD-dependent oxidoreductase [Vicinamibacteria bacterium]
MRAAVVGAGPAGAIAAGRLARDGAAVTVFDASHPREKPCGGGLTARALRLLPAAPAGDPLPVRYAHRCRFDSGQGDSVEVALETPVGIASRRLLDAWLLRRAVAAGARHVAERVVAVEAGGRLRTAKGREETFDVIVGADGTGSLVRRMLLAPTPPARLMMATGWFARGDSEMVVRFTPDLQGYLWLFPRPGHVGVGICAPLARVPTPRMMARLESEVARAFPALSDDEGPRYGHTIPSPSTDPRSLREVAGERWALVGDAAALADPITGEGIHHALRSAELLADTLREDGSTRRYPERLLETFGSELLEAAALRDRFYARGFSRRMVRFAARSAAVRDVLGGLVWGDQGYVGLKARLLRTAPAFAAQYASSLFRRF